MKSRPLAAVLAGVVLAFVAPATVSAFCPGSINFTNGAGTAVWETPENWDRNRLPVATDDVCLDALTGVALGSGTHSIKTLFVEYGSSLTLTSDGTLSIAAASQVDGGLTLAGGVLDGPGDITLRVPFTWSSGRMSGGGTTYAKFGVNFTFGAATTLSGGRVLDTGGTTTWTGGASLAVNDATVRNGGTWDIQRDSVTISGEGAGRFTNLAGALFRKTAGGGTLLVDLPFDNAGTVSVDSGTITFDSGGTGSGAFRGSPGTSLGFTHGNSTLVFGSSVDAASVFVGPNVLEVFGTWRTSEVTSVSNGTLRFNASAHVLGFGTGLTLTSSVLAFNTGRSVALGALTMSGFSSLLQGGDTVTVSGPIQWSGGQMTGAGTVNANGGVVFTGSPTLSGGRVLNTSGATLWQGTGQVRLGSNATINNYGTWDVQADSTILNIDGTMPRFVNNAGAIFRKSAGSGTTQIDVLFDNAGTVAVESGTLNLRGGGTSSGAFSGSPGTTLGMGGSFALHTLLSSSSVHADSFSGSGGGSIDVSGAWSSEGLTSLSGTTLRINPSAMVAGFGTGVAMTGGTLNLNSGKPVGLASLSLASNAILTGPDPVTVSGPMAWSGGQMTGPGTVTANGGLVIGGSTNVKDLTNGRVLNAYGVTTWTGTTGIRLGSGAIIRNFGTWAAQADTLMLHFGGAPPRFVNQAGAVFSKSAGVGTTNLGVPFENAGAVRVFVGTLYATGGYTQTGGSTSVEGGVLTSSTPLDVQGGSLTGAGTMDASVVMQAARLAPGLSPGTLWIVGSYEQSPAASFDVKIGGVSPGTQHDRVDLGGTATLAGALNVGLVNGFTPADLDRFTIMTYRSATGTFPITNLPALPGDLAWKVQRNPTSLVLEVLADLDADGVRNSSDCAPEDAAAWSVPPEVAGLEFAPADATLAPGMAWASLASQAGPGTTYDVARGMISELRAEERPGESCFVSAGATTEAIDAGIPEPGDGYYYLVRGTNGCGRGTWGTTSDGVERTTAVCP